MKTKIMKWTCPHCSVANRDSIDPVDGPFNTCVCDECGDVFDQGAIVCEFYSHSDREIENETACG